MTQLQSWATVLLALALPVAILRVLWLLAHPARRCTWCDRLHARDSHACGRVLR